MDGWMDGWMHKCKFLTEGFYTRLVVAECRVRCTFNTGDTDVTSTTLSAGLPMVKLSNRVVDELNDGVNVALPLSMDLLAAPSE